MLQIIALLIALALGLYFYERRGMRLGGVLVLPLVTAYALFEPAVLPVFFAATALTFGAGQLVQRRTFVYGRRLLYVYIGVGLVTSWALLLALSVDVNGIALAVLPGVFAFNVHREGAPMRSLGQFTFALVPTFLLAHLVLLPFGFEGGLFPYAPQVRSMLSLATQDLAALSPVGTALAAPSSWAAVDAVSVLGAVGADHGLQESEAE